MSTTPSNYSFGMIGLGTMGRNLLLNLADHDFAVAGYDKDADKVALLGKEGAGKPVEGFAELLPFINSLQTPRSVMMLVPAGKIVDSVIDGSFLSSRRRITARLVRMRRAISA